jgi:hypothetical protein
LFGLRKTNLPCEENKFAGIDDDGVGVVGRSAEVRRQYIGGGRLGRGSLGERSDAQEERQRQKCKESASHEIASGKSEIDDNTE